LTILRCSRCFAIRAGGSRKTSCSGESWARDAEVSGVPGRVRGMVVAAVAVPGMYLAHWPSFRRYWVSILDTEIGPTWLR